MQKLAAADQVLPNASVFYQAGAASTDRTIRQAHCIPRLQTTREKIHVQPTPLFVVGRTLLVSIQSSY